MRKIILLQVVKRWVEPNLVAALGQSLGHRHEGDLGRLGDHRKEEQDVTSLRLGLAGTEYLVKIIFYCPVAAQNRLRVGPVLVLARAGSTERQNCGQKYHVQLVHCFHPVKLSDLERLTSKNWLNEAIKTSPVRINVISQVRLPLKWDISRENAFQQLSRLKTFRGKSKLFLKKFSSWCLLLMFGTSALQAKLQAKLVKLVKPSLIETVGCWQ